MSRFTVGQEITVKISSLSLERGKFYTVQEIEGRWAIIIDNAGHKRWASDNCALTREEYEQAEREKDPFAPGKWVVCVKYDDGVHAGGMLKVSDWSNSKTCFRSNFGDRGVAYSVFWKSHFRPATPEEIKAQEMKIMDEKKADEARTNRQTFTVGGREFYVGQSVWVNYGVLGHTDGKPLEVVGYIYNTDGLILVRPSDALFIIQLRVDGLMTEQPKPHEWKFRDWARHPEHGVVMAVLVSSAPSKSVTVANDDGYYNVDKDSLTYISTAEIPE